MSPEEIRSFTDPNNPDLDEFFTDPLTFDNGEG